MMLGVAILLICATVHEVKASFFSGLVSMVCTSKETIQVNEKWCDFLAADSEENFEKLNLSHDELFTINKDYVFEAIEKHWSKKFYIELCKVLGGESKLIAMKKNSSEENNNTAYNPLFFAKMVNNNEVIEAMLESKIETERNKFNEDDINKLHASYSCYGINYVYKMIEMGEMLGLPKNFYETMLTSEFIQITNKEREEASALSVRKQNTKAIEVFAAPSQLSGDNEIAQDRGQGNDLEDAPDTDLRKIIAAQREAIEAEEEQYEETIQVITKEIKFMQEKVQEDAAIVLLDGNLEKINDAINKRTDELQVLKKQEEELNDQICEYGSGVTKGNDALGDEEYVNTFKAVLAAIGLIVINIYLYIKRSQ